VGELRIQIGTDMSLYHTPVLLKEVLTGLHVKPGAKYIDATVGGGGYAKEILNLGGKLLGIDADQEAIIQTTKELENYPKSDYRLVWGNFRNLEEIARENEFVNVAGILFDLGISSHQIDDAKRGFGYRDTQVEIDMRFNQKEGKTAKEILNSATLEELYEIFSRFGEEEHSRAIADAVCRARKINSIEKAGDLVKIVGNIVGENNFGSFSRIFQALRIAVNDEMGALKTGLNQAGEILASGGVLAVISFQSLEDRIVKNWMRNSGWQTKTVKPVIASQNEVENNRRSRSAKLRVIYKII
jgi:16S rRNA (cytosine1402-N4)-methyltransferase